MRIGVIGGGSVGLLFAYYFSFGHEVTVIARRKEQAEAIEEKGIRLLEDEQEMIANVSGRTELDSDCDLLFVAVKEHQLGGVLPELEQAAPLDIMFLQNGMAHIPVLEKWQTGHRIYTGSVEHGAVRVDDRTFRHTGKGAVKWSAFRSPSAARLKKELASVHEAFPFIWCEDWYKTLAGKLIVNACINPLTALLRVENGALLEEPMYADYMKLVFEEASRILELEDRQAAWDHVLSVCRRTKSNTSSMLADVLAGRKTEADAIMGYLLKRAKESGESAPHLTFLYRSIKALENEWS
ncbi:MULTISPECIES: 2-dehydropantoate 2-reductase [Bacillus]|uniref:2-dehydropantoate 2-reductase n=1 Tax=Bacillus TaxID=1386 RepID=UPI0022440679|nr:MULTISPECIES: 2-dehydropantoate 2-reductase [Bacillus]MDN5387106.1 2-dehydropantoate 2-reductase [Bacillus sp. LB7]MEC1021775.1 2-dehydropantoate 2-reductase [Bacillus paralicheniformis]MEC1025404.1 2-dehydropantoate 2-reductase [Bacillus paralicheniformis]MEC1035888.1 2-dehydropantoate 2-reductase [Bacillus paralicheniformis]MEC1052604.1 2-dehydropantoate 2-reductase [Bacillus paralicheniformis]